MKNKRADLLRRCASVFAGAVLLWPQLMAGPRDGAQAQRRQQGVAGERSWTGEESPLIERAISEICTERAQDPQGSIPIDEMAAQPPLSHNDPSVVKSRKRAERLLPLARKLVPPALRQLAADYNLEALSRDWIKKRVNAVRTIKVEPELHDNALWRPSEPHAITFGSVFLAGLRSDEAMLTILAHELTHAIDGTDGALRPLVLRIGVRAAQEGRLSVREVVAEELACESVGLRVMREYTFRTSPVKTAGYRLTRGLGKNCVRLDIADETHLSPRETMRLLLTLEPELTKAIVKAAEDGVSGPKVNRSISHVSPVRF
jgi:hypothetical protein